VLVYMTFTTLESVDGSDLILTSPVARNVPTDANADCDITSIKQKIATRKIILNKLRFTISLLMEDHFGHLPVQVV